MHKTKQLLLYTLYHINDSLFHKFSAVQKGEAFLAVISKALFSPPSYICDFSVTCSVTNVAY